MGKLFSFFAFYCVFQTASAESVSGGNQIAIGIDSQSYQLKIHQVYSANVEFPAIVRALSTPELLRQASSIVTSIVDVPRGSSGSGQRAFSRDTQISLSGQTVTLRENCSSKVTAAQYDQQCLANLADQKTAEHLNGRTSQLRCRKTAGGSECDYFERGQFKTLKALGLMKIYPAVQALTSTIETVRSFGVMSLYLSRGLALKTEANTIYRGSPLAMYLYRNQQRYKSQANAVNAFEKNPLTLTWSDLGDGTQ